MRRKLPEYDNHEMKRRIGAEIHTKRDRLILCQYLLVDRSLDRVAKSLNIPYSTVRDVWQRHRKTLFPPE